MIEELTEKMHSKFQIDKATEKAPTKVDGSERFYSQDEPLDFTLKDFWIYQYSNVWFQTDKISEFLVAEALPSSENMNKDFWAVYDINYRDNKIEVKSTADYHAWNTEKKQTPRVFDIHKIKNRGFVNNGEALCRPSDIYIFCHNKCKDMSLYKPEDSYPLDLNNWDFYIIPTSVINEKCGSQSTISLGRVKKLHKKGPYKFEDIKKAIDNIVDSDINIES